MVGGICTAKTTARTKSVTAGKWEVRIVHGVDEQNGWIYFSGTERSYIGQDVYRIRLDGSGLQRLSGSPGTHTATFSPGFSFYVDRWSDVHTPPQTRLHHADGRECASDANRVASLNEFRHSKPEFLQVKTRDGFVMEAMMIKPPDFRSDRKYPVYQWVYGGPHSQAVRNAWVAENMFLQLLAQSGIIVWVCDNRTASGKGAESTWPAFKRLGASELRDIEDGLAWLKQQPYIDGARIGIHVGVTASHRYALTHQSFVMARGRNRSDWATTNHLHERPANPQRTGGYVRARRAFLPIDAGRWMLLHGTSRQVTCKYAAVATTQRAATSRAMLYPPAPRRHGPASVYKCGDC